MSIIILNYFLAYFVHIIILSYLGDKIASASYVPTTAVITEAVDKL
jgi:hypothetical protein